MSEGLKQDPEIKSKPQTIHQEQIHLKQPIKMKPSYWRPRQGSSVGNSTHYQARQPEFNS